MDRCFPRHFRERNRISPPPSQLFATSAASRRAPAGLCMLIRLMMSIMRRHFRSKESYDAEKTTRDMLPKFLEARGFVDVLDERKKSGAAQQQILRAIDDRGQPAALWVRLCWRQSRARKRNRVSSAAQLLAKVKCRAWISTLQKRLDRARRDGITHLLLVQRVGKVIEHAAAIPLMSVIPVWKAQRDKSSELILLGKLGNRKKNHNMNGVSPTLWLKDSSAPEIGAMLWRHKGVRDLARLPELPPQFQRMMSHDSMDDLPALDYGLLGADGAPRVARITSGVKRDPKVRKAVLDRSKGACERVSCPIGRRYSGFLDVHHILGAQKSDRLWNCVALCPNCHRDAHAAPNRSQINATLLRFAFKFR